MLSVLNTMILNDLVSGQCLDPVLRGGHYVTRHHGTRRSLGGLLKHLEDEIGAIPIIVCDSRRRPRVLVHDPDPS